MAFAQRLKEIRIKNGDSQAQTAEKLFITQQQWQKYEVGKHEIPIHYLIAFCKAYHASADYILGLDEE